MTKQSDQDDQNIEDQDLAQEEKQPERDDVDEPAKKHLGPTQHQMDELKEELQQIKREHEENKNLLKRAVADYQNLEKRISEGRSELTNWATGNLLIQILPVLDNLEKALEGASEEERKSGWFKGVELSVRQLHQVLKDEGLDQIRADGQFDPALHEAVDTREGEDNQILEVVEKGYNLKGKVLRPARVVVGRKN